MAEKKLPDVSSPFKGYFCKKKKKKKKENAEFDALTTVDKSSLDAGLLAMIWRYGTVRK